MDLTPKTEPGSPPIFASGGNRNLKDMSIPELVSVLRAALRMDDYDRVEKVLMSREGRLKTEIRSLREKFEMEKLMKVHVEEELKKRDEQCERGNRALESYEALLKQVKESDLFGKNTIGELRKKNSELESENCELKELKRKWVEDSNAAAELRIRVRDLENEKLDVKMKKSELEEAVKKNLATIEELRTENHKLAGEKHRVEALVESMERKFGELNERVVRLEDDTKLLMNGGDGSGGGNIDGEPQADPGVAFEVKNEDVCENDFGNYTGNPAPLQSNEDTHCSPGVGTAKPPRKGSKDALGASAGGRLDMKNNIEIIDLDDDDDGCTPQGLHGNKASSGIMMKNGHSSSSVAVQQKSNFTKAGTSEMIKRKFYISTSSSSSSGDSLNFDNLPISSGLLHLRKKSKTEADSPGLKPR
ncbi:DNA ligase 1-like [Sesbania bispinosa]|nr:DNA ligase 1-like [Sesbania bispinosa]